VRLDRAHHLVPPADLDDHLDVGLQAEQGGQRLPDEVLVVGQQYLDHAGILALTVN
jgi:hypothetical protein